MTKSKQLLKMLEGGDEFDDEYDDSDEPQSDDIVLYNSGTLGSRTSVSAGGRHIGEFKSDDEAEKAIVDWINKNKFHPNIWYQDDHGGLSLYTLEPKNQKKIKI
jgi:hypothetical protein